MQLLFRESTPALVGNRVYVRKCPDQQNNWLVTHMTGEIAFMQDVL